MFPVLAGFGSSPWWCVYRKWMDGRCFPSLFFAFRWQTFEEKQGKSVGWHTKTRQPQWLVSSSSNVPDYWQHLEKTHTDMGETIKSQLNPLMWVGTAEYALYTVIYLFYAKKKWHIVCSKITGAHGAPRKTLSWSKTCKWLRGFLMNANDLTVIEAGAEKFWLSELTFSHAHTQPPLPQLGRLLAFSAHWWMVQWVSFSYRS